MLRHVILPLMTQSRLSLRLKTNHGGLIADMNQQLKCGNATLFWLPVVAPLNPARRPGERGFFRSRSGRFGDSPSRSTDGSLWDSVREFCLEAMLGDSQLPAGESSAESVVDSA